MTTANKITIVRILLIPAFVMMAIYYGESVQQGQPLEWQRFTAIALFLVAAVSDGLDGYVALIQHLLERGFASKYRRAVAAKPSAKQIRIGRLYVGGTDPAIDKAIDEALAAKGFKVVRLDDGFKAKWGQAETDGKTVALADAWLNDDKYTKKPGIDRITRLVIAKGWLDHATGYDAALKRKAAWQRDLKNVFKKVDFIATPTLQSLPPKIPWFGSQLLFEWMVFNSQNTVGVNFAGNPALAIPIPMPPRGKYTPVTSLQLVGPRLSEAELLNAGRLLAPKS